MQKNDLLSLHCDGLGADMEGVCRHEGMAVFVPGLLPGEEGQVRITKVQKKFAFGRLMELIGSPSPDRTEGNCPSWPRCGGCSCRHMRYEATLAAKQKQVEDCFRRIGHLDVPVLPCIGMENPDGYRNKTSLSIGGTAEEPVLGFYAPRSHRVIPAEHCPNAMDPSGDICTAFLSWMKAHAIEPYSEETHTGLVRHLVIRINRRREAMVTVVINGKTLPHAESLAEALAPVGMQSLVVNENRERTNVILGRSFKTLYGPGVLEDELCGLRFSLSPASFYQVNPVQTEKLYQTALDFAELTENDLLCDVYCGAGTITLMMARHCRKAIGIEVVPQAIDNARENALRNQIPNADFHVGAAEDVLPRLVADGLRPDVIVVDPPRKGLDPAVIDAMAKAGPRRIVYVSCNVATQARDAALLDAAGYRCVKAQPVDMFCRTSGVENVLLLSKLENAEHIDIKVDMSELDVTKAESDEGATYEEIKAYVKQHSGLNVSALYIAQVKRKHGIIERECYNKPKKDNGKTPVCPPEKEAAIEAALRYFGLIK
ncbi:MAG: 23S rRNA (uracil(1939)-C(5))-methyltransferase RlmD [Clostridia bacterium]|nr:23S rRNA (uracil(1939)-C(5))-methyltransferase RlmD [Clostridia bacterium]